MISRCPGAVQRGTDNEDVNLTYFATAFSNRLLSVAKCEILLSVGPVFTNMGRKFDCPLLSPSIASSSHEGVWKNFGKFPLDGNFGERFVTNEGVIFRKMYKAVIESYY